MMASEAYMLGMLVGMSAGIAVGVALTRRTMIPEVTLIALKASLYRALGAVRTAQLNLSVTDYGEALASAERHLVRAGEVIGTDLRNEGDPV